jgi:large subunit ribosomal protein L1
MSGRSRRYLEHRTKVDRQRRYPLDEALKLMKSLADAKFDESVELSVRLGIDPRQSDQQVRSSISLPNGTGREVRVLVFAEGEAADEARQAGADFVGSQDLAERIQGGWLDFDIALASPDMMRVVGRLGRILGPQGKMPSPKSGTVTPQVADAVREFKAGRIEVRSDEGGNVHALVGRCSFADEALAENIRAYMSALLRLKPASAKGIFIQKVVLSSTMGPGIHVSL